MGRQQGEHVKYLLHIMVIMVFNIKNVYPLRRYLRKVATVLGSIPASSDTVKSEWRQMKQ